MDELLPEPLLLVADLLARARCPNAGIIRLASHAHLLAEQALRLSVEASAPHAALFHLAYMCDRHFQRTLEALEQGDFEAAEGRLTPLVDALERIVRSRGLKVTIG